jgi:hypothetical protein
MPVHHSPADFPPDILIFAENPADFGESPVYDIFIGLAPLI